MAIQYNPKIGTNGLILYLDAANQRSYPGTGTTWGSLVNNITASLVNGATFNTGNGGSFVFPNTPGNNTDYGIFSVATFPSGNSPLTLEAVFRNSGLDGASFAIILGYGRDTAPNQVPALAILSPATLAFSFGSGAGQVTSSFSLVNNTWYHVCATYTTSQNILYINGVVNNTTNYSSASIILDNNVNGTMGGIATLFSTFGNLTSPARYGSFNGNIAKLAVYNRALSGTEVLENYNAIRSRFGI